MVVNADQGESTIRRPIYGHFAEPLGEDIYGGFWMQDDQGNWKYNQQVIDALKEVNIPNLRWPGGCFADYYHWRDGIGPRDERPSIVNTIRGGVTRDNSFDQPNRLTPSSFDGAQLNGGTLTVEMPAKSVVALKLY